jgi:hypothetical protein
MVPKEVYVVRCKIFSLITLKSFFTKFFLTLMKTFQINVNKKRRKFFTSHYY